MQKVYEIWVTGSENSDPTHISDVTEGTQSGEPGHQTLEEVIISQVCDWLREGVCSVEICVRWD